MIKNRTELVQAIKSLQRLIPGDDYSLYIEQAQRKYLNYVPSHSFLPAMDEKSPKSLNDVELNMLSRARHNYLNNVFIPTIAEKQPEILKDGARETTSEAIERWSKNIKSAKSPYELMKLISSINRRKKGQQDNKVNKPWWKRLFGL